MAINYKIQNPITEIEFLWRKHINPLVSQNDLRNAVSCIAREGNTYDYILFTLQYVINNGLVLNYPNGLRYYAGEEDIKQAYIKANLPNNDIYSFKANTDQEDTSFSFQKKKSGFQNILKGSNQDEQH